MTHDGKPLCIRDYNTKYGVRCYECDKYIAGKVLQAGGYKFHPTCARCSRCGERFGDGQEMYMQGDEIWHPGCEHAKVTENIAVSHFDMFCTYVTELSHFPVRVLWFRLILSNVQTWHRFSSWFCSLS
ncbi:unnamed protein product [Onchocerca flexuosa]|uniref:LIM zinc-binding domain-containing protein n=1 Tax=Onchocerca flexuosa TaxID=387005 RepID=A0A183H2V7_9BILA|nr:unnamed protein product [Onchocerca flexuosa]